MKLLIAVCVISLAVVTHAEIYKWVDPATGAVQYTNKPLDGAIKQDTGETRLELPFVDLAADCAADAKCKKRQEALAMLAKAHPAACANVGGRWFCEPRVGVNIRRHYAALQMHSDGFTDDTVNGRLDIWRGACTARARNGVIVSVTC
jgi:hypothetical protein